MNRHWNWKALLLLAMTQRRTQRWLASSRYRQAMEMESAIAAHPSLCLARSTSLTDSTTVGIPYRGVVVESSHGRGGSKVQPEWFAIRAPSQSFTRALQKSQISELHGFCASQEGQQPAHARHHGNDAGARCRAAQGRTEAGGRAEVQGRTGTRPTVLKSCIAKSKYFQK